MGLFSWLFGRNRRVVPAAIWFDEENRLLGLERAVRKDLTAGRSVVLVAHFADALVEVGTHLAAAGIDFRTLASWQGVPASPSVVAMLAKALPQPAPGSPPTPKAGGKAQLCVRGVEMHVKADEDARLLHFVDWLPVRAELSCSVSLEGPLMATFAKPWVGPMLQSMGMRRDQPIETPMVSRSLAKAQRQLEQRTRRDQPADSLAQWIARNVDPK